MEQFALDFEDIDQDFIGEDRRYLQEQIITYIGNKRQLLPLIEYGVDIVKGETGKDKLSCLDLFSGSGIVSRMLKQHASVIYANDLEAYSELNNLCYLSNASELNSLELMSSNAKLHRWIEEEWCSNGFIAEMYAPVDDKNIKAGERAFYTRRNAEYLDTARQQIDRLPEHMRKYFLAPLIASASVHTNTSGVFKGFYKDRNGIGCFGGAGKNALTRILSPIETTIPILSRFECDYEVLRKDAYEATAVVPHVNLAYLDPPYNQHPYGSNYFMLNLLVNYEKPTGFSKVSGIPTNWNRSPYNKPQFAKDELFKVVDNCDADYVLISYNSEGFVGYSEFVDHLSTLGDLRVLETRYNAFRGSRNLRNRDTYVKEYLFLLRKGKNVS